jgi:hypothetical protein
VKGVAYKAGKMIIGALVELLEVIEPFAQVGTNTWRVVVA